MSRIAIAMIGVAFAVGGTGCQLASVPPPEPVPPGLGELPPLSLAERGVVRREGGGERRASAIRDIVQFDFDSAGRICALRSDRNEIPSLLLITQEGELLREVQLPTEQTSGVFSGPANTSGSRFAVSISDPDRHAFLEFFIADLVSGAVEKFSLPDCDFVESVTGFDDGSVAVLSRKATRYGSRDCLRFLDSDGGCLWKKEQGSGYGGTPQEFLSPKDIVRFGKDQIAVLDCVRDTVQFFNTHGEYLRTVELRDRWGRDPSYPSYVTRDATSGLIIHETGGDVLFVRMDADGHIRSEVTAEYAGGQPVEAGGGWIKCSPQGQLWTTDWHSLLRLSDAGVVDYTVGEEP